MKSAFRSARILAFIFTALFATTGCVKQAPVAALVSPLPPLAATPGDKTIIVARVNSAAITRHSLIQMMNRMSAKNAETSLPESRDDIRKRALDKLISQELAIQAATRQGLLVEQAGIDKAIINLKENLGGEIKFQDYLAKEHSTEAELRAQVERVLLYELIGGKEVRDKAIVTDDEVRKEYELVKGQYITPEKITVVDVVLFLNQDDPASISKAIDLLSKINADKDKNPKNLASDNAFVVRDLELDKEKEPALADAARKLQQGELSSVIKARDSLHIIQLTEYIPERQMPYEEVKDSLEKTLKTAARKKRLQEWEQVLRKDAKIEIEEKQ